MIKYKINKDKLRNLRNYIKQTFEWEYPEQIVCSLNFCILSAIASQSLKSFIYFVHQANIFLNDDFFVVISTCKLILSFEILTKM